MALREKEVEIDGVKYRLRELSFLDGIALQKSENSIAELIKKCVIEPQLTDAELAKMSFMREGSKLLGEINKLNGEGDFLPKQPAGSGR